MIQDQCIIPTYIAVRILDLNRRVFVQEVIPGPRVRLQDPTSANIFFSVVSAKELHFSFIRPRLIPHRPSVEHERWGIRKIESSSAKETEMRGQGN